MVVFYELEHKFTTKPGTKNKRAWVVSYSTGSYIQRKSAILCCKLVVLLTLPQPYCTIPK